MIPTTTHIRWKALGQRLLFIAAVLAFACAAAGLSDWMWPAPPP